MLPSRRPTGRKPIFSGQLGARTGRRGERATGSLGNELRQAVSAGGLAVAVLAILVLGAVRQTEETRAELETQAEETDMASQRREPPPRQREPVPDLLGPRTPDDRGRLAQSGGRWTLQLAVACKPETAERLVERAGPSDRLYVLPASIEGSPCLRICWGSYASREQAALAETGLPRRLRAELDRPAPRPVADVTR